jgi:Mn2+/Fe2+ NRAMP family transporter
MKPVTMIGAVLILLAIVGFAVGGVTYTHEKKDVDLGPVQISHKQTRTYPISPVLSTIALVAGIGLVVVGARSR